MFIGPDHMPEIRGDYFPMRRTELIYTHEACMVILAVELALLHYTTLNGLINHRGTLLA